MPEKRPNKKPVLKVKQIIEMHIVDSKYRLLLFYRKRSERCARRTAAASRLTTTFWPQSATSWLSFFQRHQQKSWQSLTKQQNQSSYPCFQNTKLSQRFVRIAAFDIKSKMYLTLITTRGKGGVVNLNPLPNFVNNRIF